jgi:Predicted membrane protein
MAEGASILARLVGHPATLETAFALIGALLWGYAVQIACDRRRARRALAAAYWFTLGLLFGFGAWLPHWMAGLLVVGLVAIEAVGGVRTQATPTPSGDISAPGWRALWPVLTIPAVTFVLAGLTALAGGEVGRGAVVGLALGGIVAVGVALAAGRFSWSAALAAGRQLTEDIGPLHMLPQLLASLGLLFTATGVGTLLAEGVQRIVPPGSMLGAAVAYFLGMTLFTALVGNSFAAFSVITTGIGVPLVVAPFGLDPALVAILGLTAGSCGTLCTPMAANFNLLPVGLYGLPDNYAVIRWQWRVAAVLWPSHLIVLGLFWLCQ